jgi:hypothetical protein
VSKERKNRRAASPINVKRIPSSPPDLFYETPVVGGCPRGRRRIGEEERPSILNRTAGAVSREEADDLGRAIDEGCEKVDEHGW